MYRLLLLCCLLLSAPLVCFGVRQHRRTVAVLEAGNSPLSTKVADKLRKALAPDLVVLDAELTHAASQGIGYTGSMNLTVVEARDLGAALAADFYFLIDAQTLRRSSSATPLYYESYCSVFIVSARTGRLIFWSRPKFQNSKPDIAEQDLLKAISAKDTSQTWIAAIDRAAENERTERAIIFEGPSPVIEEAPDDETSAAAQGLRLPRPYRRFRPDYPPSAAEADAEATVDVLVDVRADGEISDVSVSRWAGFGLDDVTVATVRQMHFFPALRDGTPIPMRVLLRYNFRKPAN